MFASGAPIQPIGIGRCAKAGVFRLRTCWAKRVNIGLRWDFTTRAILFQTVFVAPHILFNCRLPHAWQTIRCPAVIMPDGETPCEAVVFQTSFNAQTVLFNTDLVQKAPHSVIRAKHSLHPLWCKPRIFFAFSGRAQHRLLKACVKGMNSSKTNKRGIIVQESARQTKHVRLMGGWRMPRLYLRC